MNLRVLIFLLACSLTLLAHAQVEDARFRKDVETLSSLESRVIGTSGYDRAVRHVESELKALPGLQYQRHDFAMMVPVTKSASLAVTGIGEMPVYPFWPASVRLNSTPVEGITGKVVYIGSGELKDLKPADILGQIVAVEGAPGSAWTQAAVFGARAILILGSDDLGNTDLRSNDLPPPVNIPRFFLPDGALAKMIRSGLIKTPATLKADVNWERRIVTNFYALVTPAKTRPDGWTAAANPGALLITAPLDAMCLVPDLGQGAGQAVQTAAALEMLRSAHRKPPDRPVLVAFTSGDGVQMQGLRQTMMAFADPPAVWREQLAELAEPEKDAIDQANRLAEVQDQPAKLDPRRDRELLDRIGKLVETDSSLEQDELFRIRTAREISPSMDARAKALSERQIALSQLRYSIRSTPNELQGDELKQAVAYLNRMATRLAALKINHANRHAELQRRIDLYEWLAGALSLPKDPDDRSNNSRLIEVQIALDFSDGGRKAGPVSWGWYMRVNSVSQVQNYREWFFRQERASKEEGAKEHWYHKISPAIDLEPISGAREMQSWICGTLPIGSEVGTVWGVPSFSMITLDDLRLRRDTPNDTLAKLNLDPILPQVEATRELLFRAWDDPKFKGQSELNWQRNRFKGQVVSPASGQPIPDLPRDGFLITYFATTNLTNRNPKLNWYAYAMGLRRAEIRECDAEGNYYFEGIPKVGDGLNIHVQAFQIEPKTGAIIGTSDLGKQAGDIKTYVDLKQKIDPLRNVVFDCEEITVAGLYDPRFLQELGDVIPLDARRNAEPQRYNFHASRQFLSYFVEPGASSYLVFRYGRVGNRLILINMPVGSESSLDSSTAGGKSEAGEGFTVAQLNDIGPLSLVTASDFSRLNTVRLTKYRKASVSSALVDSMHAKADEQLKLAQEAFKNNDGAGFMNYANGAWANETRVYSATQDMATDVIRAAIFLLLLCVPFSFCMERLLIGSTSVYQQIGGVIGIFAIMTAALWSFHPAFKISSSPLIIILAFAIIFMSVIVIWVVYGKFDTELKRIRSGRGSSEGVSFASAGVLMSAVLLGIANMRKRKFRTTLTSLTVVLITFAVLCFTSASKFLDVSTLPTGVPTDHPGIMLRQRGFRPMPLTVVQNIQSILPQKQIVERWWNVNAGNPRDMFHIRNGEKLFATPAMLGLSPGESNLSPHIAEVIGQEKFDRLEKGESRIIYMSSSIADRLGVKENQVVRVGGIDLQVAGIFDANQFDQKVTMLSGDPLAPLRYSSGGLDGGGRRLDETNADTLDLDAESGGSELSSNYEHLSSTEFVIVPSSISRLFHNASLRSVAMRFANEKEVKAAADELSKRFAVAMFAGYDDGVRMVVASNLASVSGAGQVAIPLAIAGLIIFNTMMGSIAERKREIHVYTSLGLAPLHVGALFVAEAMTYGLIGTVFGYVIGQGVGTLFMKLGWLGSVTLNYSGTSAMLTIALILLIVLLSALVPARLASKLAAPSIDRSWKVPAPKNDEIIAQLPFTINKTAADGALAYLADFFAAHQEGSIGKFSAGKVEAFVFEDEQKRQSRGLKTIIWLTPFDLGVRQHLMMLIHPGEFPDIYEVQVVLGRLSGDDGSWYRMNRTFLTELRKQFLQWRSLSPQRMLAFVEESKKLFLKDAPTPPPAGGEVPKLV